MYNLAIIKCRPTSPPLLAPSLKILVVVVVVLNSSSGGGGGGG